MNLPHFPNRWLNDWLSRLIFAVIGASSFTSRAADAGNDPLLALPVPMMTVIRTPKTPPKPKQ